MTATGARRRLEARSRPRRLPTRRLSRSIAALGSTLRWRDRRRSSTSTRSSPAAASRSWRSGTAAFFPPPTTSAAAASSSSPARTSTANGSPASSSGSATARRAARRRAAARKALLQLTRDMAAGKPAGFTLDGPRGPARVAQPGAVWLAKATGNPVLPFHLEANRYWTREQLGPHADSEAVRDRRDRDGRAVRRAGRRGR